MATSDAPPPVPVMGQSAARRRLGIAGQYLGLSALSLLVLGPLYLTVIQAMSPTAQYINVKGRPPLHPVAVVWQDRVWWSGGPVSIVARTLAVALLLAWLQKVAAGLSWRSPELRSPARLVAVVGGTLVFGFAMGPVFQSLHSADGSSLQLVLLAMVATAATQVWGFSSNGRTIGWAAAMAVSTGAILVVASVAFVGPVVWTEAWTRFDLGPAMWRSLLMTVTITVLQVSTAVMGAYAFVFLRFPFKRILFALFMATLLLPLEVTLVGNVATIRQLGWTDTMQALVLPFGSAALGVFLIRQGFRGLPTEIQDATRLDGYGHVAFLTKFAVPLTRPVIAAFTVISALSAWNQYLWPRSVIESNSFNTLQIQLRLASASEVAQANKALAAALVAAVPVVMLLIAFQRQIIRGLTAGAVK